MLLRSYRLHCSGLVAQKELYQGSRTIWMPVSPWFVCVAKPVAVAVMSMATANQFFMTVITAAMAMTDFDDSQTPTMPVTPVTFNVTVTTVIVVSVRVSAAMNADGDICVRRNSDNCKYQCYQSAN